MVISEYSKKRSLPEVEKEVLQFWKENQIFEKSIKQNKEGKPFVFYEGPPTANGKPGIHHVLSRVYKDIYIRFQSLRGCYVPRRAGWDCHGLPVEREVEKKLGINSKTDIEKKIGIKKFNELCRESVNTYVEDWNRFTERMGFWIDMEHAYFTYHNEYIQSVWFLLKKIWENNLIYQAYKVVPCDPVMGATLSDAEVAQGYRTVDDPSLTVRFNIKGNKFGSNCSFLVWTTTPWTLPSNTALAVAENEDYIILKKEVETENRSGSGKKRKKYEHLIVAAPLIDSLFPEKNYSIVKILPGKELKGAAYKRLFDWLPCENTKNAFHVLVGEFVTMDTGTGIVHIAPAYGADDLEIGKAYNLPVLHGVGLDGKFIKGTPLAGIFFKDADKKIVQDLRKRGLVQKQEIYRHEYPFGYRTGAPLIYYAKFAWYIRTTEIRNQLIENNKNINWVPDHIKEGRFGKWLENNRDWALSRERFWGTPLPLWTDGKGNYKMIGSIQELEKLSGQSLAKLDLHRPFVDEIEITDPDTGQKMRRVPEVIDCWFDSGAMPYAQWGYPLNGESDFKAAFPADFITEAVDQTRGWFYTLLAISTLVSKKASYKNVICLGHVLDARGEKMSKSKGNTVDPYAVFNEYGTDALRWYFLTGAPPGNSRRVGVPGSQRDPVRIVLSFITTIRNSIGFFTMYGAIDKININSDWEYSPISGALPFAKRPEIDQWILSHLQILIRDVTDCLENYDSYKSGRAIEEFTELLSNWYIRRNRRRFWKGELDADKLSAYDTIYRCLVQMVRLMAPFTPFIAEDFFRALVRSVVGKDAPESIHLARWPEPDFNNLYNAEILREGDIVQQTAYLGRAARKQSGVKVRQPLTKMMVHLKDKKDRAAIENNKNVLMDELNVKSIEFLEDDTALIDYVVKPNLPRLGQRFGPRVKYIQEYFKKQPGEKIVKTMREKQKLKIEVNGEILILEPDEIIVESISKKGISGVEGEGILVALDTVLNEELIQEGRVRDIVRNIQELRKKSGLEVTDKIILKIDGGRKTDDSVKNFINYIESETLSKIGDQQIASVPLGRIDFEIDREKIQIFIWKRISGRTP